MLVIECEEMKKIEEIASAAGIKMSHLMEQAGTKVAALAAKIISEQKIRQVCILCGSGNNGGDGLVIARLLSVMTDVKVILTSGEPKTHLAKTNFEMLPPKVEVLYYSAHYYEAVGIVRETEMIIDAIYGIGFRNGLNADIADLIGFCNRMRYRQNHQQLL